MFSTIGELVRNSRIDASKTQQEVSFVVGITRNYLSDIENNRYIPSIPVMVELSRVLNIDLNLLTKMTEIQVKSN